MTEIISPGELEQNKIEREKRIVQLFEVGLNSPDLYALHGTAMEALIPLIEGGKFEKGFAVENYLYFLPLGEEYYSEELRKGHIAGAESSREYAEEACNVYASLLAFNICLIHDLSLDIRDPNNRDFATALEDFESSRVEDYARMAQKFHINIGGYDLREAVNKAKQRKGILVGLNNKTLNLKPETTYPDEGFRIYIPNGLDLDYLCGLEPLGQFEYDFLETLQRKHS